VLRRADQAGLASGCRELTPPDPPTRAQLFELRIAARTRHSRVAEPAGSVANLLVAAGSLAVELGEHRHQLGSGDAIRFDADQPHALINDGAALAVAYVVTSGGSLKGVSSMADERPLTARPL
jgi:quercetin dioxygenase-like cupin family protein